MEKTASGRLRGRWAGMEGLEPRQLMTAVDLTAGVAGFAFAGGVSSGTASAGNVTVVVTNKGPGKVAGAAGEVLVAVKLRPANTGGGKDVLLTEVPVSVAGLGAGRSKSVRVPVVTPARLGGGAYSVVAIADSGNDLPEANEGNNVAVSKAKLNVRAVHPDLAVARASTTLGSADPESRTGTVTLKNAGDVKVNGTVDVQFVAAPVGTVRAGSRTAGIVIGERHGVRVDLGPGGTKVVTGVPVDMPVNDSSFAVKFNVWARIVPHVKPVDLKAADDSKVATPVTVAGNILGNPLLAAGLGTRLTFTATGTESGAGGAKTETGTVTDGAGHTGTYAYAFSGQAAPVPGYSLELSFPSAGFNTNFGFFPQQTVDTLGGRTLLFLTSADSTNGATVVARLNVHVAYWLVEG